MTIKNDYKRILVAMDFSPHAEAALKQVMWLAPKANAAITLVHVVPTLHAAASSPAGPKMDLLLDLWVNEGESPEEQELAAKRDAEAQMRRLIEQCAGSVEVQTKVFLGASFVEIIHAVEKEGYDLVVAGTRGLAQWEQFLVGSTAKRLIRKCPSSVWIVRAEHVGPPKVVLAVTDFSSVSWKAVKQGVWIAEKAKAAFHLLHNHKI